MNALPRRVTLLQNATLAGGSTCDVLLDGDTVAAVAPAFSFAVDGTDPGQTLDLTGFLLLTAPADPHSHLDKALSWDAINQIGRAHV